MNNNINRTKLKERKGFTLIEVVIAVTIVVILSSFAVPKVVGYIDKAKNVKALTMARQLYTSAMWSYTEEGHKFIKDKVSESISTSTGITATVSGDDDTLTLAFSSDNKNYKMVIDASDNAYTLSVGSTLIYTIKQ